MHCFNYDQYKTKYQDRESILDFFEELVYANHSTVNITENSLRGSQKDPWRELLLEIILKVPSYVHAPDSELVIKKKIFDPRHTAYWYSERMPNGVNLTTEFYVDLRDGHTQIYVHDDYDGKVLDQFVIKDLKNYSLSDVDRINAAIGMAKPAKERHEKDRIDSSFTAETKFGLSSLPGVLRVSEEKNCVLFAINAPKVTTPGKISAFLEEYGVQISPQNIELLYRQGFDDDLTTLWLVFPPESFYPRQDFYRKALRWEKNLELSDTVLYQDYAIFATVLDLNSIKRHAGRGKNSITRYSISVNTDFFDLFKGINIYFVQDNRFSEVLN